MSSVTKHSQERNITLHHDNPIKVSIAGSRFSKNWQPEKCCKMRKQKEAAGTVGTEVRRHRQGVNTLWQ